MWNEFSRVPNHSQLLIELRPSPLEVAECSLQSDLGQADAYLCELTSFHESFATLARSLQDQRLGFQHYTDVSHERGSSGVARHSPPDIVQFLIELPLISAGAGVAVYKLLTLWSSERNGRKFKAKYGELEIEATQLTEKQFVETMERLATSVAELERSFSKDDSAVVDASKCLKKTLADLRGEGLASSASERSEFTERIRFNDEVEKHRKRLSELRAGRSAMSGRADR